MQAQALLKDMVPAGDAGLLVAAQVQEGHYQSKGGCSRAAAGSRACLGRPCAPVSRSCLVVIHNRLYHMMKQTFAALAVAYCLLYAAMLLLIHFCLLLHPRDLLISAVYECCTDSVDAQCYLDELLQQPFVLNHTNALSSQTCCTELPFSVTSDNPCAQLYRFHACRAQHAAGSPIQCPACKE